MKHFDRSMLRMAVATVLAGAAAAFGAEDPDTTITSHWINPAGGNFSDAANWDREVPYGQAANFEINATYSVALPPTGPFDQYHAIYNLSQLAGNVTLNVTQPNSFNVINDFDLGDNGSTGTLSMTGGGSMAGIAISTFYFGGGGGSGTLYISGAGSSLGTVQPGDAPAALYLGSARFSPLPGSGHIDIEQGGVATLGSVYAPSAAGLTNTIKVRRGRQ